MFGIIDENKKFILLDSDHDKLRATALMLAKEETVVVEDLDEDGNKIGEHSETHYVPMFDEDTVDEAIAEYADADIETAYNGDKYVKGYAPEKPEDIAKQERVAELKAELDSTDYKIIKCSECSLAGEELPYDIAELHAERQAIRDEINELEGE